MAAIGRAHRKTASPDSQPLFVSTPMRVFLLALLLVCAAFPARGQQSRPDQYQIEATYLYDFTRFVAWPPQASAENKPFGICVLGADPFGRQLDAILVGEHVGTRSLVARRIQKPQETSACQIVFVSHSEEEHLKEILIALDDASVLTVSDIPQFSQRGGMIQFVVNEGKVRFEVNLRKASDAGLTLSSDLLRVALAVRRDIQPGQ